MTYTTYVQSLILAALAANGGEMTFRALRQDVQRRGHRITFDHLRDEVDKIDGLFIQQFDYKGDVHAQCGVECRRELWERIRNKDR